MMLGQDELLTFAQDFLRHAKQAGANSADVVLSSAVSSSVGRRMGKPETLTRSEEREAGLRVFVGKRQAIVSTSDLSSVAMQVVAERAVAMARAVPEDAYAGIADAAQLATSFPDLDLADMTEISVDEMTKRADAAEAAALSVRGVTNSEGAEFGYGRDLTCYAATNGFSHAHVSTGFSLSVSVIAGEGLGMETDYDYDSCVYLADLRAAEAIGKRAGERAVSGLGARKGPTKRVPVIFDRRIAGGVIGTLASCVSGAAVARGTTLLKDKMGEQVFARGLAVTDDPFVLRGPRSHAFDGEGLAPSRRDIISDGVLTGWLLDLASSRRLNLNPTGNASRGTASPPSPRPANFYLHAGKTSREDLIASIGEGFLVTQLMGSGASPITGDVSRGARGFWIEQGKIAYPVSEMTIAGNIRDMWMNLAPASDLEHVSGMDAPTVCVGEMTVAGS